MATQKQANMARQKHLKLLVSKGVHSIGVNVVEKGSKKYEVIAMSEKEINLPKELTIKAGDKKIIVPLKVQLTKKLKAE